MNRKGFMHIAEIIIIMLVASTVLIQLSALPVSSSDWDRTKLSVQVNDWLFIVNEKIDGRWDSDISTVKTIFDTYLPRNIVYEVKKINETGTFVLLGDYVKTPVKASMFSVQSDRKPMEIILSFGYRY